MIGRLYSFVLPILGVALIGLIAAFYDLHSWHIVFADFAVWRQDFTHFQNCLLGQPTACAELSRFPLAYILNSAIASGATDLDSERWRIVFLNFIFLSLPIIILSYHSKSHAIWTPLLYLVALLLTPIIPAYALSGHIEAQSGVLVGLVFGSIHLIRHDQDEKRKTFFHALAICSAFLLPLYKDTHGPLLIAIFGLIWFLKKIGGARPILQNLASPMKPVFASVLLGQACAMALNWLRYQSLLPLEYLNFSKTAAIDLSNAIYVLIFSIVSPNGGVLIFWSLAFLVAILSLRLCSLRINLSALAAPVLFAALQLVMLSRWWSPFGWSAWGNRLMIPAMLGLLIVMIMTARPFDQHMNTPQRGRERASSISVRQLALALALTGVVGCSAYYVLISYAVDMEYLLFDSLQHDWPNCVKADEIILTIQPPQNAGLKSPEYYACMWDRLTYFPVLSSAQ